MPHPLATLAGPEPLDAAAAETAEDVAALRELQAMAMRMARRVDQQAGIMMQSDQENFDAPAAVAAFARASRAVRLTILLKQRLFDRALARSREGEVRRTQAEAERHGRLEGRKDAVTEMVAHATILNERMEDANEIADVLYEGLDRESEDVILRTPVRETIEKLCRQVGMEAPWTVEWVKIRHAEREAAEADVDDAASPTPSPMDDASNASYAGRATAPPARPPP